MESIDPKRGEPAVPEGFTVVLPDFRSYTPQYVVSATARETVVTISLQRDASNPWFVIVHDPAPRRTSKAWHEFFAIRFWAIRAASVALQEAGWNYDIPLRAWLPPAEIQVAALQADLTWIDLS